MSIVFLCSGVQTNLLNNPCMLHVSWNKKWNPKMAPEDGSKEIGTAKINIEN